MGYPVTTQEAAAAHDKPARPKETEQDKPDFHPYIAGIGEKKPQTPASASESDPRVARLLSGFEVAKNEPRTPVVNDASAPIAKAPADAGKPHPAGERTEHFDGSAYTQKKNRDGSVDHIGTGMAPADNYHVHEGRDGSYKVLDAKNKEVPRSTDPEVVEQRKRLDALSDKFTDPESKAKFRADMAKIEGRMQGNPKEVANTYSEVASMLEQREKAKVKPEVVDRLAMDVMAQAGTSKSVDQNPHPTCNVTSVESVIYHDNPSIAANAVKDIALTGEHKVSTGNVVKVDEQSMQASSLAKRDDGQRSLATQYMNVLMVNAALAERGTGERYTKNDERIKETPGKPPEVVGKEPSLSLAEIARSYRLMTGDKGKQTIIIAHESAAEKDKSGKIKPIDGVEYYKDQQGYEQLLGRLKQNQSLPVVQHIDVRNDFNAPGRSCTASDNETFAGHVLDVDDFSKGKVEINNQWGSRCDYSLPVKQAYEASIDKDGSYRERMAKATAMGTRDFEAEIGHYLTLYHNEPRDKMPSAKSLLLLQDLMKDAETMAKQGKPETFGTKAAEQFGKYALKMVDRDDRLTLAEMMRQSPIFKDHQDIIDLVGDIS